MVDIEDSCRMYMGGEDNKGIAYVCVKILGRSNDEAYNQFHIKNRHRTTR